MPDFLLELLSEEIPARMQDKAREDLARLFGAELAKAGLAAEAIETYATPRRLALIARNLPAETRGVREETKGPRAAAPPQALEGFLRKTGLTRDQLEERDGVLFAVVEKPGRSTSELLAAAVPAIVRAFPWPKSMRWGEASARPESLRWVRPLQGIVALFGEEIVEFEIAGVKSGAATVGHRFHHSGAITIGSANDYLEKLNACHVVVDPEERKRLIRAGAADLAAGAGLTLVEDEGLVAENAGLTEWPVPLLGSFDPAFLDVPSEVIRLTMRTNQKYFACVRSSPERGGGPPAKPVVEGLAQNPEQPLHQPSAGPPPRSGEDKLSPHFVCVANIEAADAGAAIVQGNERVLSARLSDAKFFWEHDLKVPLEDQAKRLGDIVFHEKLGTLADKVDRVAKLARWLVEQGIVGQSSSPERGGGPAKPVEGAHLSAAPEPGPLHQPPAGPPPRTGEDLADLAERAARLAKADLVTQMVGEFPELQGVIGGHLARAQGEPPEVADAIRDHYKPVGPGDEVPTAPVTMAVSLADKFDTSLSFLSIDLGPTGSKDPFAIRRALLGIAAMLIQHDIRVSLNDLILRWVAFAYDVMKRDFDLSAAANESVTKRNLQLKAMFDLLGSGQFETIRKEATALLKPLIDRGEPPRFNAWLEVLNRGRSDAWLQLRNTVTSAFADRLKVQQREAGVRHDLIDAVFALGGEDDLVRLLARVRALQAFVETPEGADLLAGYKRAANILRKEGYSVIPAEAGISGHEVSAGLPEVPASAGMTELIRNKTLSYSPETEEAQLIAALDSAEPKARAAVEAEDFEGAMAALATLRAPVDAFFDKVTVNDPDPARREARLALLARMRDAVHLVADFSRIEG